MRISDWSSDVCSSDLIDRQQILARVRTAKPAEPRVGGGRGIDRKQMQNAAAERIDDMRNLARQIPELSGRRDRQSVVKGKNMSVSVDLGGRRIIKKKK